MKRQRKDKLFDKLYILIKMSIGLGCQIQILEGKIYKTRELKATASTRYAKNLANMRKQLRELKEQKSKQYTRRVIGLPTQAQINKRNRVAKAKNKKLL